MLPKGFFVPIIVAVVMIVGAFVAFAVVARNPSGPVVAPPSSTP